MDRSKPSRPRVVNLKAVAPSKDGVSTGEVSEVVGVTLGCRLIDTETTEVWTVRGIRRDGHLTREPLGELCFITLFELDQAVVVVSGFISEPEGVTLSMQKDVFWEHIRAMINQLGHSDEGFLGSIGVGGQYRHFDDFGEY